MFNDPNAFSYVSTCLPLWECCSRLKNLMQQFNCHCLSFYKNKIYFVVLALVSILIQYMETTFNNTNITHTHISSHTVMQINARYALVTTCIHSFRHMRMHTQKHVTHVAVKLFGSILFLCL